MRKEGIYEMMLELNGYLYLKIIVDPYFANTQKLFSLFIEQNVKLEVKRF